MYELRTDFNVVVLVILLSIGGRLVFFCGSLHLLVRVMRSICNFHTVGLEIFVWNIFSLYLLGKYS